MGTLAGMVVGVMAWFVVRYLLGGVYTVGPNERAVKTIFGRAERLAENLAVTEHLSAEEHGRHRASQRRGTRALRLSAGSGHSTRRALLPHAVGAGLQGLGRDPDGQHRL